ncbi:MAG: DUF2064 domain-containing protein [Aeromicrobium sp.]|uniref:TIGR04282 family arsenosugar biosynthesis glycosyltransferase n=1 Tax=Aeromicrobium sp. TaxID=1871063 RepID=UPI003C5631FE
MSTRRGGPTVLVVAKAPVPGLAKTRIAATIGDAAAAELAAAALLDTLDTVAEVSAARGWPVVVALTGDLSRAACSTEIGAALSTITVVPQRGEGLAERLAHAHADADRGHGVVQVGMDTPQLTAHDYETAGDLVLSGERALGPAGDGGWWLLGLPDGREASALINVPMSTDHTADLTQRALGDVRWLRTVHDMDTWEDAQQIAAAISPSCRTLSRLAAVVDEALAAGVSP